VVDVFAFSRRSTLIDVGHRLLAVYATRLDLLDVTKGARLR